MFHVKRFAVLVFHVEQFCVPRSVPRETLAPIHPLYTPTLSAPRGWVSF